MYKFFYSFYFFHNSIFIYYSAEEAILVHDLSEIYKLALDNYFGSVIIVDNRLKILYANQFSAEMLGATVEQLLQMDMYQVVKAGMAESSCAIEASKTKQPTYHYINNYCKKGMYVSSRPYLDEDGEIEFILTYSQDEGFVNTRLKTMERERNNLKEIIRHLSKEIADVSQDGLIMRSPRTREVFRIADQVALSDSSVLLYGESGVGKEILAKYIYNHSGRSKNPFVPVNCAAIPKDLMESEFFGYEKGAFTGAVAGGKPGLFELANHGTIFLDELGDLPLSIQAKFLRVLENGEYRKVGGKKDLFTNVRVIGATNKNLQQLVARSEFREDLYYRLSIIPIFIPPLRDRTEDIVPLAQSFLDYLNQKYSTTKTLGEELKDDILHYSWPGNLRELRNFIERLYIISQGNVLVPSDDSMCPFSRDSAKEERIYQRGCSPASESSGRGMLCSLPLKDAMERQEKIYIEAILAQCDYNVTRAAERLGIHRTGLHQKIKKLGIQTSPLHQGGNVRQ
jgi:transcriptional regulator with PAS, ATPase and Fis domain